MSCFALLTCLWKTHAVASSGLLSHVLSPGNAAFFTTKIYGELSGLFVVWFLVAVVLLGLGVLLIVLLLTTCVFVTPHPCILNLLELAALDL